MIAEPAWLTPAALAIPVAGQQAENLVIQVPGADVLFGGAMCSFGVTPNAFDGDPEAWADALGEIAGMATTIVPGIGPVGGVDDVIALQAYLYACVEADGDVGALPEGPWDEWSDRDLDPVNVERAALLADRRPQRAAVDARPPRTRLSRAGPLVTRVSRPTRSAARSRPTTDAPPADRVPRATAGGVGPSPARTRAASG